MGKLLSWMITLGAVTASSWWFNPEIFADLGIVRSDAERVKSAWSNRESNIMVEVDARVIMLLPDQEDFEVSQQFFAELENGHRVLVSHNLDVAKPVPVMTTSQIRVKGEYDWTETGGMIHWTHHDTAGARDGGWIEHDGKRYQ